MEGSAKYYHIILSVGLIFASAIYVLYSGIITTHFEYGRSDSAPLDSENFLIKTSSTEDVLIDQNTEAIILNYKVERNNKKVPITMCPYWSTSSTKMKSGDYFYDTEELYKKSTCDETAASRGPNQHVVSFSFYGDVNNKRGYFKGIEENAKLIEKYYPNWIMRLYHDLPPVDINQQIDKTVSTYNASVLSVHNNSKDEESRVNEQKKNDKSNETPQEILCHLMHTHSNLDLCYVGNIPGFGNLLGSQGNMWRFLTMADPLVDVFISRDLDSRPSEREIAAVNEWLKSNMTFHIMRDHPYHSNKVLAGMWGAALYTKREELFNLTVTMMIKGIKAKSKGLDQELLADIVWPAAKGSLMQHDSYFCSEFGKDRKVDAWPTRRNIDVPYNFVGARMGVDTRPMKSTCPVKCRPQNKTHWVHC